MEPEPLFQDASVNFKLIRELLGLDVPPTKERKPSDDVWDAVCAALGWEPHAADEQGRKRVGRAVVALCAMQATPAEIRERASRYRQVMPNVMMTPESLTKHWSSLAPTIGNRTPSVRRAIEAEPEPAGEPMEDLAGAARAAMAHLRGAMELRTDTIG